MKVTSTDIKNSFGKYLRLCANEPIYITKNGQIIAKLVNDKSLVLDDEFNSSLCEERAQDYYHTEPITMGYDEFLSMNEGSSNRYEYIDGQVYLLASPTVYHQWVISRLHVQLDHYFKGRPCDVFQSPFDIILTKKTGPYKKNVVQPDLMVLCDWRKDIDQDGKYQGIPTLVVEVLSASNSTQEMFRKLNLYKESGIQEYWIIDPQSGGVLVYHFDQVLIKEARSFSGHEDAKSIIYPGLAFRTLDQNEA